MRRGLFAATLSLCSTLGGCVSRDYAGIFLTPGFAPADLQALAGRARAGDKQAQFALGERYERGDGVTQDQGRATELYRAAAADSGGMRMMFVPRRGGAVSAVPVSTGAVVAGLPEAQAKLEADRATAGVSVGGDSRADLKRHHVVGRLRAVGPSNACTAQAWLIKMTSDFHIVKCVAELYQFEPRHGAPIEVVDLALTTDDDDAIRNLPIPFGLFDSLELGIDTSAGVAGTLTYDVASRGREQLNIIRSLVKGR